ncbi:MAG TPA: substrate-binding domain-containing protein [Ohtaekwangia sp.]|nr:substrate-binding domain-containing protein [Ohtaekwangia sp.]
MGKSSIRIKDIAKLVGVSVGTVDRVIHNRGEVSQESYKKIMAALEQTGYKPNLIARTLGSNKTYRISALVPDPRQDEYWKFSDNGLQGAIEEWHQYGVFIEPCYFDLYSKESFKKQADTVLDAAPDGILTAPVFHQEALEFFDRCREREIPFVLFNNNIVEAKALTFVGQDLYASGRLGGELLQMGQRSPGTFAILHIYDDVHSSLHLSEKERGFKDYFANQQHDQFKVVSLDLSAPDEAEIQQPVTALLEDPALKGILVTTSKGASIVSALLEKHGKNNIRLVAYDLLEKNLAYLRRGTIDFLINQNSKKQAFLSVSKLVNYLLFKKAMPATHLFPLEIISRQNLDSYLASANL